MRRVARHFLMLIAAARLCPLHVRSSCPALRSACSLISRACRTVPFVRLTIGSVGRLRARGDRYLRALFVQAAWVAPVKVKPKRWEGPGIKPWIAAAKKRLHRNVLAIALADRLARIAWSILARGRAFEASKLQAA